MSIVSDFKSIRQKLERQEQKAEFEEKNPKPPEWYGMPCIMTPFVGEAEAYIDVPRYIVWGNQSGVYVAPESDPA